MRAASSTVKLCKAAFEIESVMKHDVAYWAYAWLPADERWMHISTSFDRDDIRRAAKVYAENPLGAPRMVMIVEREWSGVRPPPLPTYHPYRWPGVVDNTERAAEPRCFPWT